MAKLNGVVLTAAAIEYNGVKYEMVFVTPKAGDILRVDESPYSYVTGGAYYEVDHVDNSNDPQIIDNDGDVFDGAKIEYTLFRKVTEPQTSTPQQYREVKRKAKVGERIKIVEPYMSGGRYRKGDELIVSHDTGHYESVEAVRAEGIECGIYHREYVVLEPIVEQADDIIVVDGVKYRKVDRAPKVGDFAYALKDSWDLTEGSVYEIRRIDSDGDGVFQDNVGDSQYIQKHSNILNLVERITTAEDLERQVSELQTKLTEVEAELAAKKAEEEAAKRLKVGEYAKVIGGDNIYTKIGDIVVIRSVSHRYYGVDSLDGCAITGVKYVENLTRATDEEVAEAKRKLELSKFTRGTHVQLTVEEGKLPKHGWGGVKNGEVGVVSGVNGSIVKVDFPRHSRWSADPSELTILTAEEAEEVAKWAAIGRKVGEFKEGDIARVTPSGCGDGGHPVGTIGVIEYCPKWSKLRLRAGGELYSHTGNMELVAPVESVVNLTA